MSGTSHRPRRAARPAHPPFTDLPLAAYMFAAAFDVASLAGGVRHHWAAQLWHAGTFVLLGGLGSCLITMGTGFWDLVRFWPRSPGAARTVAAHVSVMAVAFMIGAGDIALRLSDYGSRSSTPPGVVALSLAAAVMAGTGGFLGGKLVFGHGVGVAVNALVANKQLRDGPAADDHEHVAGRRAAGRRAAPASARQQRRGRAH